LRSFLLILALSFLAFAPPAISAEVGDPCTFGIEGQCGEGKWCDPEPGMCWQTVKTGKCVIRKRACPRHFLPECGCDGQTYSNACGRIWAEQPLGHDGKCLDDRLDTDKPR
jgi:hypothetical protein